MLLWVRNFGQFLLQPLKNVRSLRQGNGARVANLLGSLKAGPKAAD